ncbi:MAG: geranylgeranylglyceryl/heptaprenylglyceryl phosphate synthase [Deferribacteres bacterium]|nr:geranylgeranylglyceryl/heptaprenylglyceryl phosphate synthase [candidate division KSB1 bacterium]MCB9511768.1 geranylgeranylglyceryl/heptaprenylglyceryl phosphate synthase [Deferribacteres bacterium]
MSIYQYFRDVVDEKGAGYFVLIDPDRLAREAILDLAEKASAGGADALFVGSSLLLSSDLDDLLLAIRAVATIPIVIFPGNIMQISRHADAILFLSLISGRNPNFLIGEQVRAAPIIRQYGIEPISTGYMLIDSGRLTSAEFMSNTRPIPRDKHDIAKATALAAEYLGMRLLYLEAGSGAQNPVSPEMIREVAKYASLPIIAGGGIRTPQQARERVQAGASFIVTGNVLENNHDGNLIREFASAVHSR